MLSHQETALSVTFCPDLSEGHSMFLAGSLFRRWVLQRLRHTWVQVLPLGLLARNSACLLVLRNVWLDQCSLFLAIFEMLAWIDAEACL